MMPIQGVPSMFASGGNQYRCPALANWGGGLIGAAVGAAIGNNSTLNGNKLTALGTVLGAVAGNQIACEYVRPNVVASVPQQGHYGNSGYGGQGGYGGGQQQQGRTVNVPSDCDVGTVKDLKGLSEAECLRVRQAMTVNRPGHCRVAGVDYPEFIDNPTGCDAKRDEIRAQGNQAPQLMQVAQAAGQTRTAPRDNTVRACKLQQGPGTPVLAVSVPDPANPSWKVVPSNPGETCQEWKSRAG